MPKAKRIILLGATGSIGSNTLEIIRRFPKDFQLVGISAHTNSQALAQIAETYKVPSIALSDESTYQGAIQTKLFPEHSTIYGGDQALHQLIETTQADMVVVAIVGAQALSPTLKAIEKGLDIALANKELLVLGGSFVTQAIKENNVRLLPIDSEHNAIFQCLHGNNKKDLKSIILTASGGGCRDTPIDQLQDITPQQAKEHPNWSMGAKITIDSATMANKGLELIEARWLFDLEPHQLKVTLHPESIVHSFVQWIDGSVLAQLSPPSMTFPIQHCLFYPDKRENPKPSIDFDQNFSLNFAPPDLKRYPCLELAYQALKQEPYGGAIYNAANEIAVQRFIAEELRFTDIPKIIENALNHIQIPNTLSLDSLLQIDQDTRDYARQLDPKKL
jgi:1-deoxy-D-xylulose-5-phosphate reductoisomerase